MTPTLRARRFAADYEDAGWDTKLGTKLEEGTGLARALIVVAKVTGYEEQFEWREK
jgi:hypothetical protein